MSRPTSIAGAVPLALVLATATAQGQSSFFHFVSLANTSEAAAASALRGTPAGAFAPLMTTTMVGVPLRSPQLAFRYGYLGGNDNATLNNFGVTALFPAGTGATLSLSGGVAHPSCDGCDNSLMLSVGGDMSLFSSPLAPSSDAGRLTMTIGGELGYGKPRDGRLLAGAIGVPFALVLGSGAMKVVPFVTPAFGFGSSDESGSNRSDTRVLLGGGVGLFNPHSSVSAAAGFQQVFITDGKMLFGIALSLGGR